MSQKLVRILLATLLSSAFVVSIYIAKTQAHGSMRVPLSRVYHCFLEGPESPQSEACRAAVAQSGTQNFMIGMLEQSKRYRSWG